MPSELEQAINRFRSAVLSQEMAATRTLIAAYQPARERLVKRIDELVTALQERPLTASELKRWERAVALAEQVEAEVARLSRLAQSEITAAQERLVAMAGDHAKDLALVSASQAATIAAIESTWNRLRPGDVESFVGRMADGSPLGKTLSQFGSEAREIMTITLQQAVATSMNPRATAAILKRQIDAEGWKLLRIARTETLQSYRSTTLANYRANDDILSGWEWISAHQTRTCLACLSLDGQVFPLTVEFQPSHVNCRCSSRAIIKGEPLPDRQTGSEWFDAQSLDTQLQMIPKSAHDDFKSGKVRIQDFVQLDSDPDWGDSYRQSSVTTARENARRRQRAEQRAA